MEGGVKLCTYGVSLLQPEAKEDAGDGGTASPSSAYRQHSSDIVQRLVLVKVFHKLSLFGLLFMQILIFFSFLHISS